MLAHQSSKYQTFSDDERDPGLHPLDQATWWAKLTLAWATPLAALANERPLQASDLWPLQQESKVHSTAAAFDAEYHVHGQSVLRAFVAVHGRSFAIIGALKLLTLLSDLGVFVGMYFLLQALIMERNTDRNQRLLVVGGTLLGLQLGKALARPHLAFHNAVVGIHLTSALRHMLFEKALVMHSSNARWVQDLSPTTFATEIMQVADVALNIHRLWTVPLHIAGGIALLYYVAGNAMVAGVATGVAIALLHSLLGWVYGTTLNDASSTQHTTRRMSSLHRALSCMEMVKWHSWERAVEARVLRLRAVEEVALLRLLRYLWLSGTLLTIAPTLVVVAVFGAHTVLAPGVWPVTLVFPTLALVHHLQTPCALLPQTLQALGIAYRALRAMQAALRVEPVDDTNVITVADRNAAKYARDQTVVAIHDGTFHWAREAPPVLERVRLKVKRGDFVVVHGDSGKSSLCMAVLGEMHKAAGTVFLGGSIAYVAQKPWVQRLLSVRDNILFGKAYDRLKYQRVVDACALSMDFLTFPVGDKTEPVLQGPSAKGVVLSPAQEARISLARACYSDADIYVVDGVLAAMDANVAGHIFRHCFLGVLQHKTLLLTSNDPEIIGSKYIDATVCIERGCVTTVLNSGREKLPKSPLRRKKSHKDGPSASDDVYLPPPPTQHRRSQAAAMTSPPLLVSQVELTPIAATSAAYVFTPKEKRVAYIDATHTSRSLVLNTEDDGCGSPRRHVSRSILSTYTHAGGGAVIGLCAAVGIAQLLRIASELWLAQWAAVPQTLPFPLEEAPSTLTIPQALRLDTGFVVYAGLALGSATAVSVQVFVALYTVRRAAIVLFRRLLHNVLWAPLAFFDGYPLRRLLARFRDDVHVCDVHILFAFSPLLVFTTTLGATFLTCVMLLRGFGLALLPWAVAVGRFAIESILPLRELQRLQQLAQAPLSTLVTACVEGNVTIRAFGNKQLLRFYHLHRSKIEAFAEVRFATEALHAATALRLQLLGVGFQTTLLVALWLCADTRVPSVVGLLLMYAVATPVHFECIVHMLAALETWMVAPERMLTCVDVELEDDGGGAPWFPNGRVVLSDVELAYKPGDPLVLKSINIEITAGEKLAISGRPGAGKSAVALALFRLYAIVGGRVTIDDVDTAMVDVHQLRRAMAIVPQYPTWFHPTVRAFLDPENLYGDDALWSGLQRVVLADRVATVGLDGLIGVDNDEVFTIGERQLLCLCRAILQRPKILIVDEACAEIEPTVAQVLRDCFAAATVVTMTQRNDFVRGYDRILELEAGELVLNPTMQLLPP
ncbi:ATP-binding cassette, sub-family C (CFTR/MRP), member 3 [Achlya hypogyna]|uniref:ATP-binding cassette, sub-family C (CFTR/MRP), member 3 n=1 Tax=Achlya hypogyna TaxID=1202772 RepID=A0A1V9ZIX5_ACHHY|nr:ATP-binding cassette, sub-family C (CFTR/MRP), member 3 [Achlya hypogyna]